MKRSDPIWITGMGTANPLGLDGPATIAHLLGGKSGIRLVTELDLSNHRCRLAGVLSAPLPVPHGLTADEFDRLDEQEQLLLHCCVQALHESGCGVGGGSRIGLVVGLGSEWMGAWEKRWRMGGGAALGPEHDPGPVVQRTRSRLGLNGPAMTIAAACASANFALAHGRRLIEQGILDVCLAGGIDRSINHTSLACFDNIGVLSRRNDDPAGACRPFDCDRDGLVVSEGGALFVLERSSRARKRGAHVYAELAGFGSSSDSFHMVIPSPDPQPAVQAVREALDDAQINPDQIDYINAHATSTPVGDRQETKVLKTVLGEAATRVPVSATKSMTGHLLSAAAALDAIACLAALERQAIPPTINLEQPDPECDLCHVAREARPQRVQVAVSNSFGFGGSNSCLVLRKVA
jgi:3-oxoacyl-[acyl-carrier-protein] synthase II